MLAGYMTRELRNLPDDLQVMRAQGAIDTLLENSAEELDKVRRDLSEGLYASACRTLHSLNEGLERSEEVYRHRLNSTTEAIDSALAPSRDAVRAELQWHQELEAARLQARRRAAESRRGFKRSFTWRDPSGTALSRAAAMPKHPVVSVCEASSLAVSLILLLAMGDVVSRLHILDAHYGYQPAQLEARRLEARGRPQRALDERLDFAPAPAAFPPASLSREVAFSPSAFGQPAYRGAVAPRAALPLGSGRPNWWSMMRYPLAVYLASLGVIVMRSGTDEWAALAIGIVPDEPDVARGAGTGYVHFEYDWEKDEWRQA